MDRSTPTRRRGAALLTAVAAAAIALVAAPGTASAITGGYDTYPGDYPYVAEVLYTPPPGVAGPGSLCTGTLIHPRWVLTAQHCAQDVAASTMTVRVGSNVRYQGTASSVTEIRKIPGYQGGHNDLALLRLSSYITTVPTIPIAPPGDSYLWDGVVGGPFSHYDDGVVAGWGRNAANAFPDKLQNLPVSVQAPDNDGLGIKELVLASPGPCGGDSGGPLLVTRYNGGPVEQAGVLKGAACGAAGANYSDVGEGSNRDWILTNIPDISAPNPLTCKQGFVWRNAWNGDAVCVTPATRTQVANDNAAASSRVDPSGAYGPNTCRSGYVWRAARPSDLVCVTPQNRQQAVNDNNAAQSRIN